MMPVILIPALNPDDKLIHLIGELNLRGMIRMIVVDDGSDAAHQTPFEVAEELGCTVVRHERNRGKGAALRSAFAAAGELFGDVPCITADADGQHLPEDIVRIGEALQKHPGSLVLGKRTFTGTEVPWKSRIGNQITSKVFRFTAGISCSDTQTGLRGIPSCLLELARTTSGNRYEYEMNFLMDAVRRVPLLEVPVETVYEDGNRASHFRPVRDSLLVYGRPLRFAASSLAGAVCDVTLFALLLQFLTGNSAILAATILARIGSGIVNFLMNKFWSFQSRSSGGREAVRYGMLFVGQMFASAGLATVLSWIMPSVLGKLIADTTLFFASYVIQQRWVFSGKRQRGSGLRGCLRQMVS